MVVEQVLALLPRLPSGQMEADRALLQGLEPKLAVLQPLLAGASMTLAEVMRHSPDLACCRLPLAALLL